MTSRNDITGDLIKSKGASDSYRDNWDRIFGKKHEIILASQMIREKSDVPPELISHMGLKVGDALEMVALPDGTALIRKAK